MKQGELARSGKRRFPGEKRFFAAILAAVMALCLLPRTAFAAGETPLNISTGSITFNSDGSATQGGVTQTANPNGYIITQTNPGTSTPNTVTVAGGTHSITLSGVNISVSAGGTCAFKLEGSANVTLTLLGDNTLKSGQHCAGLQAPSGTTLAIAAVNAAAKLTATSGNYGAGIGGGSNSSGGAITINGGVIVAKGLGGGAGIGGGFGGNGGTITINGGDVKAEGDKRGAGIGGGASLSNGGNGGVIKINDGKVEATGGTNGSGAGIGGGGGSDSADGGSGGEITISGGMVTARSREGAGIGGGNGGNYGVGGNGGSGGEITISNGTVYASSYNGAGIGGGHAVAGAGVGGSGGDVTISGGTVTALGITRGAGIGGGGNGSGGNGGSGGNITISNGTVTATGGGSAAGVGGGIGGAGGDVTISGGTLTATGGIYGAGVGGGDGGAGGNITISGGTLTASGGRNPPRAIGAGRNGDTVSGFVSIAPAGGKGIATRVSDTAVNNWNAIVPTDTTAHPDVFAYNADAGAYNSPYAHITEAYYDVTGTVTAADTGAALVGASVQLKKGANSIGGAVTTGANGAYTIPNAPGGTGYTIEVSYTGYDTGTIPSFDVIDAVMGKDITLSKTLPGATVDNVTVDGTTGTQIVATAIKITLANGAFKETIFDYNWFTNLPAGLTVSGSYSTDTVAVIFVSGTPTAACSDAMRITIPKGALRGGTADIVVTANPNAKWDITAPMPATYTATVINGTGGGAYTAGESVSITADAPAAGKQFKKWTANSDGVVFADKTAATTTFPMPAGAVTVTATYADIPNPPTPPAPSTPSAPSASTMAGGVAYTGNAYAGTWNGGTLTVQADCAKLTSVTVDGAQLRKDSDYTVDCGSTIIAFTPAYLATLRDGAHAIRVQFADGQYTGSFTTPFATAVMAIANVPATGSVPIAWALLALAAGLGLVLRRRRV